MPVLQIGQVILALNPGVGTRHGPPIRGGKLNIFGKRLREIRLARGISSTDVVAKLQVKGWAISRETFSYIEGGQRVLADAELVLILKVLDAKLSDLE
jgi:hypothetical protein